MAGKNKQSFSCGKSMLLKAAIAKKDSPALRVAMFCMFFNIAMVVSGIGYVHGYSSFDLFTESLIRSASLNYAGQGLFHNAGLPTISPDWIKTANPAAVISDTEHVYLHYPSVPYLFAGVETMLFGVGDLRYLRVIPVIINTVLLYIFLRGVFSILAYPTQRRWFLVCFAAIPMGWLQLNGFSPNVYAHYVLMALIGVLLPAFREERPVFSNHLGAVAALYGFFAGCFTWDYIFIVVLAPLAVAALYHGERLYGKAPAGAVALRLSVCIATGFMLAQGLHLLQIAIYDHSFHAAVIEMTRAAFYRGLNLTTGFHPMTGVTVSPDSLCSPYCRHIASLGPIAGRFILAVHYLFLWTAVDSEHHVVLFAPVAAYLIMATAFVVAMGNKILIRRFLALALTSTGVCLLWLLLMPNHGASHTAILPHNFYIIYILISLFIIENFAKGYRS
jgi:hypothetical protein